MTTTATMMTTTTMTTTRRSAGATLARLGSSSRAKLAAALVLIVAIVLVAAGIGIRSILHRQLDDRIRSELVQESQEFRRFVEVTRDDRGTPLSVDLARAGTAYVQRSVLAEGELVFVIANGRLAATSTPVDGIQLSDDAELIDRVGRGTGSEFFELATDLGPARMLSVPVFRRDARNGTFVVGRFVRHEQRTVSDALGTIQTVGLWAVLLTALASWWLAALLLRPLRRMSTTAQKITAHDTSQRLEEPRGNDEIAVLARTFNSTLDRLDATMMTQRTFLADAAHDLRTPLTVVRGHAEQLRDGLVQPDEVDETVALIADEIGRMGRMVNDLILLARAEQPAFLELGPVDLADLVVDVHRRVQNIEGPVWHPVIGVGIITADADRLIRALLNLAENAARYAPPESVVEIGSTIDPDGRTASLWVSDRGPGVPQQAREAIFERAVSGPERAASGSGLGLAITRAIARAHGGDARLDAAWHPGARFVITVPVDTAPTERMDAIPAEPDRGWTTSHGRSR